LRLPAPDGFAPVPPCRALARPFNAAGTRARIPANVSERRNAATVRQSIRRPFDRGEHRTPERRAGFAAPVSGQAVANIGTRQPFATIGSGDNFPQ